MKAEVPFIENSDDRCVVSVVGMVLAYFMPERKFTMPELEDLCGYIKSRGTWKAQSMLNLANLGFQLRWIEDFDNRQFVLDPKAYLKTILDDEAYQWQVEHSDLDQEAARIKQYMDSGLLMEHRPATREDIRQLINDGWLVHLEVNGRPLIGQPGYEGHSILVIGYDDTGVIAHNPGGKDHNTPNQHVPWSLLDKTWKEFGGSYSLYAFKK